MSNVKFSSDLLIGVPELKRFQQSLDTNGFRKNIIDNSVSFGLIKNTFLDSQFTNGKVQRGLDVAGNKTIKVLPLTAIDQSGNFLVSPEVDGIVVPNDNNWYWVKATYTASNAELGTFTISENGDLVDTSGTSELLNIFRVAPYFPTRIKFIGSTNNTLEYDVLNVIDNQRATLIHPASNSTGQSQFVAETGLQIAVIGTFTKGKTVDPSNKNIFNYDSATIQLVQETSLNAKPTYTQNTDFYLARVQVANSTVIIQDKRNEYWQTTSLTEEVTMPNSTPNFGIESAQYGNYYSAQDRNIVYLSWGMRSNNWSVDTSNNIVTMQSGGGGTYKTVSQFTNGDFDGHRLYTPKGNYRKILSSVKQGSAINFTLDVLDIDDFSTNGGGVFIADFINVVPDCEEIEVFFNPQSITANNVTTTYAAYNETFRFPINTLQARCDVLVFADPTANFWVKYRYKSEETYSTWFVPPYDNIGYYNENSFDGNGNLLVSPTLFPYSNDAGGAIITLQNSNDSLRKFRAKVDKGDLIGVEEVITFDQTQVINLVVGVAKNYYYIHENIAINNDIFFALDTTRAIEGNEFRIHFNCDSLNLNGKNIYIVENYGLNTQNQLKKITQGDVYEMLNQEGGIVFDLKYKGVNGLNWIVSQNYDLGQPFETTMFDGDVNSYFDTTTGMGTVRGYYGWALHTILKDGRSPVGIGTNTEVYANSPSVVYNYNVGQTGGNEALQQSIAQMPAHSFNTTIISTTDSHTHLVDDPTKSLSSLGDVQDNNHEYELASAIGTPTAAPTNTLGRGAPIPTRTPYYALAFIKRQY